MEQTAPQLIICIRNLLFSSKVISAARAANISFRSIRNFDQLKDVPAKHMVIDLNEAGAIEAAKAWRDGCGGKVTGFVAHVDGPTIAAARQARLDRVLSNGAFSDRVDEIVRGENLQSSPEVDGGV